jgi:arylsulfatase A-like enzyme
MRNSAITVVVLAVFAMLTVNAATPPNIVIILSDDLGYGDPGCYNPQSKIPTPNIDRLASEGMRFTDAHAPGPLCHMSRYGLLTGQYPFRVRVDDWRERPLIADGQITIASLLKAQGYQTAMVGKWHCGFKEEGYDKPLKGGPVDRGFDTFFGIRASTDIEPYFYIRGDRAVEAPTEHIAAGSSEGWSPVQGAFWREGGIAPNLKLPEVLPRFTEEAIDLIKTRDAAKPLFLYLALPAPHTPWLPSEEFAGRSGASMYGDFLIMTDAMIGRVLAALEDAGMRDNTLVIFSSDNGPMWLEEDVARFGHDASGGLRGMKGDAWEGGHRVPFIVRWPGRVQPASTSAQMICFTDFMATFAALTNTPLPEGAGPDSFNFLPVLLGEQPDDKPLRAELAIASGQGVMTLRSGPWKLIRRLGSGGFSKPSIVEPEPGGPEGQLYNLAEDPGESTNRYLEQPDRVKVMKARLNAIHASTQTRP